MHEISIIIILIYQKLGSVRPVQQKIKLPSPNDVFPDSMLWGNHEWDNSQIKSRRQC